MLETFGALGCKAEATRRQNHTKGLAEYGRPDKKKVKIFDTLHGLGDSMTTILATILTTTLTTNFDNKP